MRFFYARIPGFGSHGGLHVPGGSDNSFYLPHSYVLKPEPTSMY